MGRIYTDLVNDALTEYAYDAYVAGLTHGFGCSDRGIYIGASGYNEKVRLFLYPCYDI